LQLRDRAVVENGIETGIIHRLPSGGYLETHRPLTALDAHGRPRELERAAGE